MYEGQCPLLSIDVGGTKVRFVSYSPDLKVESENTTPSKEIFTTQSPADFETLFKEAAKFTNGNTHFQKVGLSMKGAIKNGQVVYASLVGGAEGIVIEPYANEHLQYDKFNAVNDVVAMTKAELTLGQAKNSNSLLFVNLGTGIRMCYAENNVVIEGSQGCAGEIGHQDIWVNEFNQYLPIERIVSGKGIEDSAKLLLGKEMMAKDVLSNNNPKILRLFLKHLYATINQGIYLYNPETIIFGGSVTLSADKWIKDLKNRLQGLPKFQQPQLVAVSNLVNPASLGAIL